MGEKKIVTTNHELETLMAVASAEVAVDLADKKGPEYLEDVAYVVAKISCMVIDHLTGEKKLPEEEVAAFDAASAARRFVTGLIEAVYKK